MPPRSETPLELYGNVDSKFRFVIVAAMRAKQLIKGAKPKIILKTKNPIRLAQAEVRAGLIDFHILHNVAEDIIEDPSLIHAGDVDEADDSCAGTADDGDLSGDEVGIDTDIEEGIEEALPEVELVEEKDDE
ncbi:MAG: DNA-directed RNA polymerase subunit omega [Candidatus Aminicenantes bacterium]|nr:DNA-directed RNA polymerase subunit omega [Candidatus Aminicenantes bacterium]